MRDFFPTRQGGKKNPDQFPSPGISLFLSPNLHHPTFLPRWVRSHIPAGLLAPGLCRFSAFLVPMSSHPYVFVRIVTFMWVSFPVTAAGPLPFFTGFPFQLSTEYRYTSMQNCKRSSLRMIIHRKRTVNPKTGDSAKHHFSSFPTVVPTN